MAQVVIDPTALVLDVATKQPGLRWPIPIDARLDALVGAANAAGAATNRTELLAALVLAAPTGAPTLRNTVLKLRVATVGQTALGTARPGRYDLRRPGRPSRKRSE